VKFVKLDAYQGPKKTVWINPYAVWYVYAGDTGTSIVFHSEGYVSKRQNIWITDKPVEEVVHLLEDGLNSQ